MNWKKILGFSLGPLGSAILGVCTLPIMAWFSSPEDIGRIAMLQVVINLVVIVSCLGLDQAYGREYHETADQDRQRLFVGVMIPSIVFTSVVFLGIFLISPSWIATTLFSIASPWIGIAAILCFISAVFNRFFALVLRMQEKGFSFSMSQLLPKLIFLCLLGGFAMSMGHVSFEFILISQVISMVVVSVLYAWSTRSEWRLQKHRPLHLKKDMARHLAFGLPLAVAGVASWGVFALDRVFLRNLSGFAELGIYSIAASVGAAAGIVTSIFNIIWAPTAYKWQMEGRAVEIYDAVTRHVLAAVVILFMGTGMLSGLTRFVLPDEYSSVQFLVNACMAAPLFYALSEATGIGIGIARKSHYSMYVSILSVLAGIIGCLTLIPKFGGAGAAISTAIAIWLFMCLRTEFSCLAWRPQPRGWLYVWSLIMLIMLIAYALTGSRNYYVWLLGWMVGFVIAIISFRASIAEAILLIRSLVESRAKLV